MSASFVMLLSALSRVLSYIILVKIIVQLTFVRKVITKLVKTLLSSNSGIIYFLCYSLIIYVKILKHSIVSLSYNIYN